MTTNTARLLQSAIRLMGSEADVCGALDATPSDFAAWLSGISEPQWPVYERLVNLVIEEQQKVIDKLKTHSAPKK